MPGRRSPRTTQGTASSVHADGAFLGALHGTSNLPAPIGGIGGQALPSSPYTMLQFRRETYIATGGRQVVELGFTPIVDTEAVYLNGIYIRGGQGRWTREWDSRELILGVGANSRSGDVLVIMYVHGQRVQPT